MTAKFSKKHYEAIAELFRKTRFGSSTIDDVIDDFAKLFFADNPKFSRTKFYDAIEGGD